MWKTVEIMKKWSDTALD